MPLAFCANAVTAVFSSHVVESWHQRRRGKILAKISRKCAIVVKLIAKVLFPRKRPGETYLAAQFVEAGRAKWRPKFGDAHFTYFPVWEKCILESIEEPLAKKRRQQSPMLKRAMKTTITMTLVATISVA